MPHCLGIAVGDKCKLLAACSSLLLSGVPPLTICSQQHRPAGATSALQVYTGRNTIAQSYK